MIQKFIVHACKLQLINNIYQKTLRLGCVEIHIGAVWATSGGFYPYASGELLNLTFWVGSGAGGGACDLFREALCVVGQGVRETLLFGVAMISCRRVASFVLLHPPGTKVRDGRKSKWRAKPPHRHQAIGR